MIKVNPYLKAVFNLVYPDLCEYCQAESKAENNPFCVPCLCKLPYTNFEGVSSNGFTRHFRGRVPIQGGAALFYLNQGGGIEKILYRLKYEDNPQVGKRIGCFYGDILRTHANWNQADGIIPVPLHPKKLRKRGYNQSLVFAQGIAGKLGIPVFNNIIERTVNTQTQTKMNRIERLLNTEKSFQLRDDVSLIDKHIILVDDVLTTGATLEACANQLNKIKGISISMLTIAFGS